MSIAQAELAKNRQIENSKKMEESYSEKNILNVNSEEKIEEKKKLKLSLLVGCCSDKSKW